MQIVPGLYSLGDKSGSHVRAYLLDDGRELTLIDSLLDKGGERSPSLFPREAGSLAFYWPEKKALIAEDKAARV